MNTSNSSDSDVMSLEGQSLYELQYSYCSKSYDDCDHKYITKDDYGVSYCEECGIELNNLDFTQEWRWFGSSDNRTSKDPSRCHYFKVIPKGIKSVLSDFSIELP